MDQTPMKFMLYVVRPGDDLTSICARFKLSPQDVERFNPLIKNRRLFPGQPLNLLVQEPGLIVEETRKDDKPVQINALEQRSLLDQIAFYTKEAFMAKIFQKDYAAILRNLIDEAYLALLKLYHGLISPELSNRLLTFISSLHDAWFSLIDKILDKRYSVLELIKSEIKSVLSGLAATIKELKENLDDPEIIAAIKKVSDLWQTFIVKLASFRFQEAEETFKEVLKAFRDLEQLSLAQIGPEKENPFTPEIIDQIKDQYQDTDK